ncbi:AlbA family DNA-binding domain-containing protein [Litoribacter ruber]|uniref:AlbA family DNA-binding domain-containing protein n=1 Tax=Litoribacter ruber TaxID=702568 RepID=UPI001FE9A5E9|nr:MULTISPECIES: ATP-binding protein [Litoribacter]
MISIKKDNDFIKEILKSQEGIHLDFKQGISNQSKIAKTIAAFANTKGGKLVIGISDKKQLIGIDAEEEMFMIDQANQKHLLPPAALSFEIFEVDYIDDEKLLEEKFVLVVTIPESSQKPHLHTENEINTLYIRDKDRSIPSA